MATVGASSIEHTKIRWNPDWCGRCLVAIEVIEPGSKEV